MYAVAESVSSCGRKMQTWSYAHGPGTDRLIYQTLPSLLCQRAQEIPNKPAHIFRYPHTSRIDEIRDQGRIVVTYGQLRERSLNLAAHLLGMGVNTGDKVAVIGSNCVEWIYLEYACLSIGALLIKVPAHFCTAEEISTIIRKTNSTFLVPGPKSLKVLMTAFPNIMDENKGNTCSDSCSFHNKIVLLSHNENDETEINSVHNLAFATPDMELCGRVLQIETALNPDDCAAIFLTSGSTGTPKSVLYTHFGMINTVHKTCIEMYNLHGEVNHEVIFNDRPFAWLGSLLYSSVIFGIPTVHVDPELTLKGDETKFLVDTFGQENISAGLLMPYLLFDIMNGTSNGLCEIPSKLRNVATGGEIIPGNVIDFAMAAFEAISIIYGCTECLPIAGCKLYDAKNTDQLYRTSSLSELKITDEHGSIIPIGEIGNIQCRNPFSMQGYIQDDSSLVGKPSTGWINIGDLGIMGEDGSFHILGRTKDVISRGTVKVYPAALEKILDAHVKVDKAIVVGVPNPRLYQEVCACIKPKDDVTLAESELSDFFKASTQAQALGFTPTYYMILNELPMGSTGKYDRKLLAKKAIEHFKLE